MLELALTLWLFALGSIEPPRPPPKNPDFARDVKPILEKRCQPCHFPGGKMHATLPFDRAETIDKLGTKLFSRLKKEHEQAVVRAFLARK